MDENTAIPVRDHIAPATDTVRPRARGLPCDDRTDAVFKQNYPRPAGIADSAGRENGFEPRVSGAAVPLEVTCPAGNPDYVCSDRCCPAGPALSDFSPLGAVLRSSLPGRRPVPWG